MCWAHSSNAQPAPGYDCIGVLSRDIDYAALCKWLSLSSLDISNHQGNSSRKGEERKTHSHWKVVKLTHITDDIILNIENPIKSTARNKTVRMSELVQQEQNTIYKNYLNFCRLEVRNLNITMEKQFHSQLVSNELSVQVKVTYDQF